MRQRTQRREWQPLLTSVHTEIAYGAWWSHRALRALGDGHSAERAQKRWIPLSMLAALLHRWMSKQALQWCHTCWRRSID